MMSTSGVHCSLFGDNPQALAHCLLRLSEVEAQAFAAVRPVGVEAEEEVFAGDDQYLSGFEPFVEFAGRDLHIA